MMFRAAFSLFALGIVAAQQSVVFHTQGRGGESCGKYHRCIDTARCEKINVRANPFYGEHLCLCSDLTHFGKDGNGLVSCVEKEDKYITIQNDPHLRSFLPDFADLASPCRYKLAHLVIKPSEKVLAEVELFGENTLVNGGKYYMSKAILRTNINVDGDILKQVMSFSGDVSRISDDLYNYTLVARSLESEGIATSQSFDIFNVKEDSPVYGYFMDVSKNEINNLLVAEIRNLGIQLDFRPPSVRDEDCHNTMTPFVPGAVFRVRSDMWNKVVVDRTERQLANWPEGKPLKQQAEEMIPSMTKDMYVQYLMLNSSTPAQENEICHDTENIWARSDKEEVRHLALEKCTSLYTEEKFLTCISEENLMDKFFVLQRNAFQRCLRSFVDADVDECKSMKTYIKENTHCPMPMILENMDCSIVKRDNVMA